MKKASLRVAVMLDLESAYSRHTALFDGIQRYADLRGWEVILDEYADDTLPARRRTAVPYDGIIARATRKLRERASRLKVPAVNVWLNSPVRGLLPGVFPDFLTVGRIRAEHFLSRGLSRFACLTTRTAGDLLQLQGFLQTLNEAGHSSSVSYVPLSPSATLTTWRKTEQVIAQAMQSWEFPIGVNVAAEDVGRIVAQLCRTARRRVPEDVAIIAGLNQETLCLHPRPSLTSVELGSDKIGYEAARLLDSLMAGQPPPSVPILIPPRGLIARESTDFLAVDDETVSAALSFIAANSHRPIGPSQVAKAAAVEIRTLQLRFRKVLNRPIAAEIRRVRIERAKRQLAQTKRQICEIARDVGFGKSMRMYEVFRRELGITPSEYRKQRQVEN